ncbi:unnamed protein product [Linum trigynum]|uniref:Uncharacterized protein n=1 Tax=Linum trigynum TaxID=586398 RepID=A0AAV2FMB1_9ROSI
MKIRYHSMLIAIAIGALFYLLRVALFKTGLIYLPQNGGDSWKIACMFMSTSRSRNSPSTWRKRSLQEGYSVPDSLESMQDSDFTNLFTERTSNEIVLPFDPNQTIDDYFLELGFLGLTATMRQRR